MNSKILNIQREYESDVKNIKTVQDALGIRKKYFGKNGMINTLFEEMKNIIDIEDRKEFSTDSNIFKRNTLKDLRMRIRYLNESEIEDKTEAEEVNIMDTDVGEFKLGKENLMDVVGREIKDVFYSMGYEAIVTHELIPAKWFNYDVFDEKVEKYIKSNLMELGEGTEVYLNSFPEVNMIIDRDPNLKKMSIQNVYMPDKYDVTYSKKFTATYKSSSGITLVTAMNIVKAFLKEYFFNVRNDMTLSKNDSLEDMALDIKIMCNGCLGKGCLKCDNDGFLTIGRVGLVKGTLLNNFNIDIDKERMIYIELDLGRIAMYKYELDNPYSAYENNIKMI